MGVHRIHAHLCTLYNSLCESPMEMVTVVVLKGNGAPSNMALFGARVLSSYPVHSLSTFSILRDDELTENLSRGAPGKVQVG